MRGVGYPRAEGGSPVSLILDPDRFAVLRRLAEAHSVIAQEYAALEAGAYQAWPDTGAYSGVWSLFILFLNSYPDTLEVDFEANQRRCPRTMEFLRANPRIFAAGFSRMEPGCHIEPHVDEKPDTQLRAHLALTVPERCGYRLGHERSTWTPGRVTVFEGLIDHETANFGDRPRDVFLVDFELTEEELAYSRSVTRTADPRFFVAGGGAQG